MDEVNTINSKNLQRGRFDKLNFETIKVFPASYFRDEHNTEKFAPNGTTITFAFQLDETLHLFKSRIYW